MAFRAPIGISNFVRLRTAGATYVDKTAAIVQLLELDAEVLQFTRPRRFGKTLFLSTLEAFFQRSELLGEDSAPLFEELAVWRSEAARAHHQRYPVISLSLKDVSATSWESMLADLQHLFGALINRLLPAEGPATAARASLAAIRDQGGTADQLRAALANLMEELRRATGQRVMVLIDEYDTPMQTAWAHGFFDKAMPFFRSMFGAALKDNDALFRGVLTGILRVARESLFSGFNNPAIFTVTNSRFADLFGFTQPETEQLAVQANVVDQLDGIKAWYDGYVFGAVRIYNPWSILHYLANLPDALQPYWLNSGGTTLIESLLDRGGPALWRSLEDLYTGGVVRTEIAESLVFSELERRSDALWSLLLAAGYLKPARIERIGDVDWYELVIPNREVRLAWRRFLGQRLEQATYDRHTLDRMLRAMFDGDEVSFGHLLQQVALKTLSYHDTAGDEPERVWQAFVLGMLVALEPDYEVHSNLETGYGRADVIVRPRRPGRPGVVLELKRIDPGGDVEASITRAFQQIEDRAYVTTLRGVAEPIRVIAAVFEGKRVHVRVR
jgi:hypothetical protein